MQLTPEEKAHDDYKPGVSCPHCSDQITEDQRNRYEERQKQMTLAKERGVKHLGAQHVKKEKVKTRKE